MSQTDPIKLAVLGQPVAHSLSPSIHRLFGEQLDIDVEYIAIESDAESLPDRLSAFRAQGGVGANLTVPLKQAGLKLCAGIERAARQAQAVNTLEWSSGGWHGHNTDGAGLMLDFDRLGITVEGRRVLVVGAGGAVAGILGPLLDRRPAAVTILNRTRERAEGLADRFAHRGDVRGAGFESGPGNRPYDLLIQSTSAGHADELPPIDPRWLADSARGYDLNYGPAHDAFSEWSGEHSLAVEDGLGMLVGQAALAFEIWSGHRPDLSPVLTRLRSTSGAVD